MVARRAGKNFTAVQLTQWFQINGFFVAGSTYWNVAFGLNKGEVEQDKEGMETARQLRQERGPAGEKAKGLILCYSVWHLGQK